MYMYTYIYHLLSLAVPLLLAFPLTHTHITLPHQLDRLIICIYIYIYTHAYMYHLLSLAVPFFFAFSLTHTHIALQHQLDRFDVHAFAL